jgi:diacylglycerol kinase family enzyme
MRVLVLLNAAAGGADPAAADRRADEIRRAFATAGVDAELRAVPADQLATAAREAVNSPGQKFDAVVAAGGDGTVSAVASALAGSDCAMGVLPAGTLNHFARDLRQPLTLDEAARTIAAAKTVEVDVGEVNGRCFVNNSSIGLYPHVVVKRDREMNRLGLGKWAALFRAWLAIFRRFPTVRVKLALEHRATDCDTPFVFVGNNRYDVSLMNLGSRDALDRGELCVYFTRRRGRWALLRLAVRTLLGRLEQSRDFETVTGPELWIETRKKTLRVSIDGEVVRLTPPLHYRIRPKALRVIVPARPT